ncbi:MAG: Rpn family recombination-promoting nuclease/putative transposase [Treponema sp.]|nr:Rpn family recombination-promoting nuclease/putative transposase [Candidatus Treponema equifaecale]
MKMKPIEELTFADSFMFAEVMKNPKICRKVLELLLDVKIKKIEYPKLEKHIDLFYSKKGIRLDVYTTDGNRCFDVEIQTYKEKSLGKRCRYYQSMMDSDLLSKGMKYSQLKESYVIFICTYDPFGLELPRYTFKRSCSENPNAQLNDKSTVLIYNASAFAKEEKPEVKAFLDYLTSKSAKSTLTKEIDNMVESGKFEQSWINQYMAYQLHEWDVQDRAMEEKAKTIAKKMLLANEPSEKIITYTGLELSDVQEIQEELKQAESTN